jgi:hypothetical protein
MDNISDHATEQTRKLWAACSLYYTAVWNEVDEMISTKLPHRREMQVR